MLCCLLLYEFRGLLVLCFLVFFGLPVGVSISVHKGGMLAFRGEQVSKKCCSAARETICFCPSILAEYVNDISDLKIYRLIQIN